MNMMFECIWFIHVCLNVYMW